MDRHERRSREMQESRDHAVTPPRTESICSSPTRSVVEIACLDYHYPARLPHRFIRLLKLEHLDSRGVKQ
jgi:hypothetical protein